MTVLPWCILIVSLFYLSGKKALLPSWLTVASHPYKRPIFHNVAPASTSSHMWVSRNHFFPIAIGEFGSGLKIDIETPLRVSLWYCSFGARLSFVRMSISKQRSHSHSHACHTCGYLLFIYLRISTFSRVCTQNPRHENFRLKPPKMGISLLYQHIMVHFGTYALYI